MMKEKASTIRVDLAAIRDRVESDAGKRFWQSLEELAKTPEYTAFLHHEFPNDPAKESGAFSRRDALKLMAASAAMAGLTACTKLPAEKIFPYAAQPPSSSSPADHSLRDGYPARRHHTESCESLQAAHRWRAIQVIPRAWRNRRFRTGFVLSLMTPTARRPGIREAA
jgi:MoCo/4Fe-4S cofactor protein with predicted Tat translocation signal